MKGPERTIFLLPLRVPPGISQPYRYWGIWNFSPNKLAAKSLLLYLSSRDAIGKLMEAGQGFDVPPFEKLNDFGIWAAAEPPKGTLYNFPRRRGSACRCIRKASGAR